MINFILATNGSKIAVFVDYIHPFANSFSLMIRIAIQRLENTKSDLQTKIAKEVPILLHMHYKLTV